MDTLNLLNDGFEAIRSTLSTWSNDGFREQSIEKLRLVTIVKTFQELGIGLIYWTYFKLDSLVPSEDASD